MFIRSNWSQIEKIKWNSASPIKTERWQSCHLQSFWYWQLFHDGSSWLPRSWDKRTPTNFPPACLNGLSLQHSWEKGKHSRWAIKWQVPLLCLSLTLWTSNSVVSLIKHERTWHVSRMCTTESTISALSWQGHRHASTASHINTKIHFQPTGRMILACGLYCWGCILQFYGYKHRWRIIISLGDTCMRFSNLTWALFCMQSHMNDNDAFPHHRLTVTINMHWRRRNRTLTCLLRDGTRKGVDKWLESLKFVL